MTRSARHIPPSVAYRLALGHFLPPAHSRPAPRHILVLSLTRSFPAPRHTLVLPPGTFSSYLCRQKRPPYPGDTRPSAAAERQRAVGVHQRQFCQRVRGPAAPLHCNPGPYAGNDARFLVRRPAHLPLTEIACYFGCTMSNNATFHFHTLCIFLAGGSPMHTARPIYLQPMLLPPPHGNARAPCGRDAQHHYLIPDNPAPSPDAGVWCMSMTAR